MNVRIKVALNTSAARLPGPVGVAHAAGLFDGEGCVHIARQKKATARRKHIFRLAVSVAQNHLDTLLDFQNHTGVEGRIYQTRRRGTANRDTYSLTYDGRAAAELLDVLLPYLRRKRDEALVGLSFQRTCDITRHFGPKGCPEPIWLRREAHYRKLRNLK